MASIPAGRWAIRAPGSPSRIPARPSPASKSRDAARCRRTRDVSKPFTSWATTRCSNTPSAGSKVEEWITTGETDGKQFVQRNIRVAPSARTLSLVLALNPANGAQGNVSFSLSREPAPGVSVLDDKAAWAVSVPAHDQPLNSRVAISNTDTTPPPVPFKIPAFVESDQAGAHVRFDPPNAPFPPPSSLSQPAGPQEIVTKGELSPLKDPYVVDDIPLPLENPWHRNVRLTSIAFFKKGAFSQDGMAAGVTFDGDVWGHPRIKGRSRSRNLEAVCHRPR